MTAFTATLCMETAGVEPPSSKDVAITVLKEIFLDGFNQDLKNYTEAIFSCGNISPFISRRYCLLILP